jgi:hypothetical protein
MKKFLLLISFMISCYAFGQTAGYIPFPENYIQNSYEWYQPTSCCSTYTHNCSETIGDTVLGSYMYKKFYKTAPTVQLTGAIRNDIPAKKVYYYDFNSGVESLVFNFDLSIGDTVYTSLEDTIWVSDIDSVLLLDGIYHNRYNLVNSNPAPCICAWRIPSSLVEGLGYFDGNVYFNEPHGEVAQSQFGRSCAVADGVTLVNNFSSNPTFPGHSGGCNSILGIEKHISDNVLGIYPIPSKNLLHLKYGASLPVSYKFINMLGELILNGSITSVESEIDITFLPKGVYCLELCDLKGNNVTRKIIKE